MLHFNNLSKATKQQAQESCLANANKIGSEGYKEKMDIHETGNFMAEDEEEDEVDHVQERVQETLVSSINNIKRNIDEQLQQRQTSRSASPL